MRSAPRSWIRRWSAVALLVMGLAACAPPDAGPNSKPYNDAPLPDSRPSQASRPLAIALFAEPAVLGSKFAGGGTGVADYHFLFAAKLAHYDETGTPIPVLLQELPSLDRGTWKVFPDGTMETRYTLRSGLTWHDGNPLTAEDVRFTWTAVMDPTLPANDREPEKFITSLDVLDPLTLVAHWGETYIFANAWELEPIPRHLFETLAQRDPQSFANSSYWGRDWVGPGPYQVVEWVQGAYLRGKGFSPLCAGRPEDLRDHRALRPRREPDDSAHARGRGGRDAGQRAPRGRGDDHQRAARAARRGDGNDDPYEDSLWRAAIP
jgi:ABC-type transport system substrate-binding protein